MHTYAGSCFVLVAMAALIVFSRAARSYAEDEGTIARRILIVRGAESSRLEEKSAT